MYNCDIVLQQWLSIFSSSSQVFLLIPTAYVASVLNKRKKNIFDVIIRK